MTRLRVSAVFHRSVGDQCVRLNELKESVAALPPGEDVKLKRQRVRKLVLARERLMMDVGRMVRLGRMLRSRLKEPLFDTDT